MNNPKTSINFLDVAFRINSCKFETVLYSKPTDCHQFLYYDSVHPIHIKKSIVYCLGYVLKDYVRCHWHLKNTFRVYVLGSGNVVTPRNLLRINLEGQQKTHQSSYLNIKQNIELVCHLQLHTILGSMIQAGSLEKTSFTYMLENKSNRSLHQAHFCRFDQLLV